MKKYIYFLTGLLCGAVLFSGTIRENLLWGNENASDDELWSAVETSQSADVVKSKENGLDSMI